MPDITSTQAADALRLAHEEYNKGKLVDVSLTYQNYPGLDMMEKFSKTAKSGSPKVSWKINYAGNGNFRWTTDYEADQVNIPETLEDPEVEWTQFTLPMAYTVNEVAHNSGGDAGNKILDLVETRVRQKSTELVENLEPAVWGKPVNSSDVKTLKGIQYWIVPNATGGFNGGLPTGFTSVATLVPATYDWWNNYTDTFGDFTRDEVITTIREAAYKANWRSQKFLKGSLGDMDGARQMAWYAGWNTVESIRKTLEGRNSNLSEKEVDGDSVMISGVTMTPTAYFDVAANVPQTSIIYGIDHGCLYFMYEAGRKNVASPPKEAPYNHNVIVSHFDSTLQLICTNRRRQIALYEV